MSIGSCLPSHCMRFHKYSLLLYQRSVCRSKSRCFSIRPGLSDSGSTSTFSRLRLTSAGSLWNYPAATHCGTVPSSAFCRKLSTIHENDSVLTLSPNEFVGAMRKDRIWRGFVVRNADGSMQCSHSLLKEIQKVFQANQLEYDGHEAVFFARGTRTDCLMSVSLWRTNRGQGAGGVDFKPIPTMANFLMEGNLFSKSLGIKNALAGMWAGGGKGMIAAPEGDNKHLDPEIRRQTFLDFGDFLTSLNGCMVAGAGVGSCVTDMDTMFTHSRYVTNVSTDYGGSVNTAKYTGLGVVKAMEAAIDFLQMGCLEGKTVAIQGAGNVGEVIIDELLQKGVRHIYASECNNMRAVDMRDKFRYKSERDMDGIYWSTLRDIPRKCKWPVKVCDWGDGEDKVQVFCHSDNAYTALKNRKHTIAEFLLDIEWAKGTRVPWTAEELQEVHQYFELTINAGHTPGKTEVEKNQGDKPKEWGGRFTTGTGK